MNNFDINNFVLTYFFVCGIIMYILILVEMFNIKVGNTKSELIEQAVLRAEKEHLCRFIGRVVKYIKDRNGNTYSSDDTYTYNPTGEQIRVQVIISVEKKV
jgi:hypothetical protein